LTMIFRQKCDDAINFPEFVGSDNDGFIAVIRHLISIAKITGLAGNCGP